MPNTGRIKAVPPLDVEITDVEVQRRLHALVRPRGPRRIYEWASCVILLGCVLWPIIFGKPLSSIGATHLADAGLHTRHLSVLMGFLGLVRLIVLIYDGKLHGWCPKIRGGVALFAAFLWCEYLVASSLTVATRGDVNIGIPIYFGLMVGELICCVKAVIDARYPANL